MTSHEYATFLAGSANRARVVTALHEDGTGTVGSISDRLSMSRSTVHRSLRTFTEYGWTRRVDGTYRLTEAGELVLDAYETLIRTIEWVEEYEEFLTHLDDADGTFPIHGTTCANMVSATKDDPYRATTYIIDALTETSADRIRCITPIVSPLFADAARRLLDRGARIELIVSEPSLESAVQRSAEQQSPDSVAGFDLYSVPEDLPFGVTILDGERVLVSAFDDRGNLRACLDGKNPDFVEWATSTYETRRGESRRANVIPDL